MGESPQGKDTDLAFSTFDEADDRPVQPGSMSEGLLCQVLADTQNTDALAEKI